MTLTKLSGVNPDKDLSPWNGWAEYGTLGHLPWPISTTTPYSLVNVRGTGTYRPTERDASSRLAADVILAWITGQPVPVVTGAAAAPESTYRVGPAPRTVPVPARGPWGLSGPRDRRGNPMVGLADILRDLIVTPILTERDPVTERTVTNAWTVWQGSDFDPRTGEPVIHPVHNVQGRPGSRHPRLEHVAWCSAMVTRVPGGRSRPCTQRFTEYVTTDDNGEPVGLTTWSCPDHGADNVTGCTMPAPVDSGTRKSARAAADIGYRRLADIGTSRVVVGTTLNRPTRAGRRRIVGGTRVVADGVPIRPEPSEPVIARTTRQGWPTTRSRTPADGGRVLIYGPGIAMVFGTYPQGVPARFAVPAWSADMAYLRDHGLLTGVRLRSGRLPKVRRAMPAGQMAALASRDPRVVAVWAATLASLPGATRATSATRSRSVAESAARRRADRSARLAAIAAAWSAIGQPAPAPVPARDPLTPCELHNIGPCALCHPLPARPPKLGPARPGTRRSARDRALAKLADLS